MPTKSNEPLYREASEMGWEPGFWPDRVIIEGVTYRMRRPFYADDGGVAYIEYRCSDDVTKRLHVYND